MASGPYAVQSVDLAPSHPLLTAVDPYANAPSSADGLKPARPFWYAVDAGGLTILRIDDDQVVYRVPWPATVDVVLPEGEFMTIDAPPAGWEPVAMTVSYPTEESLASTSETPAAYVLVVMAHSGYEWASDPDPPDLRDPGLRDTLVPATSPETESSMLLQVDVTDPSFSPDTAPNGPPIAGAILGHGAGQPAFDPATGNVYVGNMPSPSLPATPRDLTSFVSVIAPIALAEAAAAEPPSGAPPDPPLVLCGPEHPDEGLAAGVPYVWPCFAEGGEGILVWEFVDLPSWVTAHQDKLTGELDGILYGTPPSEGTWTFQVRATDLGEDPANPEPLSSLWTTVTLNVIPTAAAEAGEGGFEVGVPGGQAVAGTGSCTPAPTASPGSMVPRWIDVVAVPGGCALMGTAPISGEYYEFALPGFHFPYPYDREPVIFSGSVLGPYGFDPVPAGVTISGLAWHQIDKIHDASTEADILNGEFIGVEPFTGQLYRILLPQGSLEVGEAAGPPETSVATDEVSAIGEPLLASLTASRPDVAAALAANPSLKVRFGDVAVEAIRDPHVFVTAARMVDPTGADPTVIAIGGPAGSTLETGALMKVVGTRGAADPADLTWSSIGTIDLPGVQALFLGLDSNLAPAVRGEESGQVDHGVLWVTGTTSGNVAVVDTGAGSPAQLLEVPAATSLGGVSVDFRTRAAYVAGGPSRNVTIFGTGAAVAPRAPTIWTAPTATFYVGQAASFPVVATGWPVPTLSYEGALPTGVTLVDNGDGTATLAGTPAEGTGNDYAVTLTASNGVAPDAAFAVLLTVVSPPTLTSPATTTFTEGVPGSFTIAASGGPAATVTLEGDVPSWLTLTESEGTGTATLDGTPPAGSEGVYAFRVRASTGTPPDAIQQFTLLVRRTPPPTGVTLSTNLASPQPYGTPIVFTATATGSSGYRYRFYAKEPGATSYAMVQDYGAANTWTLPASAAAGQWSVLVYVRTSPVVPVDVQAYKLFTLRAPPATGVTLSTSLASPQPTGTPIVFTATGAGSSGYQYRFYAKAPGETSYTMVQEYSSASTWTLPDTSAAGQWSVLVYVRTNPNVLVDAQAYKLFTLRAPPATGVTLSTNWVSPHPTGTPVVFTATGTGSSGYQYRFYLKAPGEPAYTMVQDYGVGSTWTLPALAAIGQYSVLVYVRTSPTVLLDAQAYKLFTVREPPATGVTLSTSATSPRPAGTPIVFTASATGSSGYQYRFYAKAPGATSYTMVQDYGPASTWTLDTAIAGQWSVLVYVRTSASVLVDAQTFKLFTFTAPMTSGLSLVP